MTKKEIHLLTEAIKAAYRRCAEHDYDSVGVTVTMDRIAEALAQESSTFNKRKFWDACTP